MNDWYANSADLKDTLHVLLPKAEQESRKDVAPAGICLMDKEISRRSRFKTVSGRMLPAIIIVRKNVDSQHSAPRQNAEGTIADKGGDVLYLAEWRRYQTHFLWGLYFHYRLWWIFMLKVARFSSVLHNYANLNVARLFCDAAEMDNKKAIQKGGSNLLI